MLGFLKKLSTKYLFAITSLLLLSSFLGGSLVSKAIAQTSPIPPNYVPCGEENTADPEYHSLRPYQKSPCENEVDESQLALLCGNQLVLQDTVSSSEANCETQEDGSLRCSVAGKQKLIAIDLSGADLPILGNTENVLNSQQRDEDIPDGQKVSEYASWYLNGVTGRAEYPYTDTTSNEGVNKVVDFAGPLNKLLPLEVQNQTRIQTIKNATEEETRHNQIVACIYAIPGTNIGGVPGPCYEGGLASAAEAIGVQRKMRLSDWEGRLPPLESDIGDEYENYDEYWQAYQQWQGKFCPLVQIPEGIPVIGGRNLFILCGIDNPFSPNFYSSLFHYIPFSSTEDEIGRVSTESVNVQPTQEDVEVENVIFEATSSAELYFSHTKEVAELTSLLQKTYVPDGLSSTGSIGNISPSDYGSCDLTYIRTNPGDDLFAGEVEGLLTYDAEFACEPEAGEGLRSPTQVCRVLTRGSGDVACAPEGSSCSANFGQIDCPSGFTCGVDCQPPQRTCEKTLLVGLSLQTETPRADEIWERTVAGSSSIFKRIFPKIGVGGPILGLLDMPGATKVNYTSADGTPVLAGNPGNQRSGESAELYFPHLGGVEEYFLKGIQTILRPKGFGEQIISGEPGTISSSGEINCNQDAPEVSLSSLGSKETIHQLALNWVGQPGNHVLECYNDVVNRARDSGVNAALAMWVWLHESGGSNYDFRSNVLDFGSIAAPAENFNEQIESFLRTAQSRNSSSPQCAGQSISDMEAFAYIYATGTCDPSEVIDGTGGQTAAQFYNEMQQQWNLVTSCPFLDSPTDTSCP